MTEKKDAGKKARISVRDLGLGAGKEIGLEEMKKTMGGAMGKLECPGTCKQLIIVIPKATTAGAKSVPDKFTIVV